VQDLDHSEVILLLGTNPLLSQQSVGLLYADASRRLKAAKKRGLQLICIDPRRTETARLADLHLQPLPGRDPAILAAVIRVILDEGWEDRVFCDRHVGAERLAGLRAAMAPFTPTLAEALAGLQPGQIRAVAETFAHLHKAGPAVMTTGGSFNEFANLTQHLCDLLNVICGRFKRAGDRVAVDMLMPPGPVRAEVIALMRFWEAAPPSRIRGVGSFFGEKLSATLADEILTPGPERMRCLFASGGNPATVVPDQGRMSEAMRSLELSVTIDPFYTTTAQLSDYVIAPTMMYERADLSFSYPGVLFNYERLAQFTPALIAPPADSDLVGESDFLFGLASGWACRSSTRASSRSIGTPLLPRRSCWRFAAVTRVSRWTSCGGTPAARRSIIRTTRWRRGSRRLASM
jgi:anaerobic selenocysteine-containing dehydrogenase